MNSRVRRRVFRNFAASLLLSEMTASEMRQLADELNHGNISLDLADLIRDMAELAANDTKKKDLGGNRNSSERNKNILKSQEPQLKTAMNAVNRRRLSKKALWEIMRIASPGFDTENMLGDATLREHVSKYLTTVSVSEASRFLNLLEGDATDAYLRGISKRG